MPKLNAVQTNFSVGELGPLLTARIALEQYQNACSTLENFIVQRYGGIRKRGGTEYISNAKAYVGPETHTVRLAPFIYSTTQAYVLEFGNEYVRFYINGGQLQSSGSPVEVATPWGVDEIWDLQFAQSADVLYITHPNFAPRTLSRTSATTFVLETIAFEDGPFLELNTTGTSLTPAARGSVTNVMTDNTTPGDTVASDTASANAYLVFDGATPAYEVTSNSGWISYTFDSGTKVADAYWLRAESNASQVNRTPTAWKFQGYDGSSWVTLDSRTGETGWSAGETRYYEFTNQTGYEAYRFIWTATDDTATGYSSVGELGIHERAENQTAFNLTASAITGINEGQGFLTTDVGRHIRFLGSDGRWRWAKIVARTSTTVVTVRLYGHALPDLDATANWRLGAWSDETGWPKAICFYSGRLCFANTETEPQTLWMSKVDDFTDFGVSSPIVDDDALNLTLSSESVNDIRWLAEGANLFVGTSASIRTVGPSQSSGAISPTNISQKRETNYAASSIPPVRYGNTALYTGYYRQDIRELSYSFDVDGFVSQDLSILCNHICKPGIRQMALAQNPDGVVWIVLEGGALAGMTYERDQQVIAFHRHVIGGNYDSGNPVVESVATIPSSTRDETWLVVKRTVNGNDLRYIERLTFGLEDTETKDDATFLDCHLTYSGPPTSSISGLDHLDGETVKVWGDGAYLGEYMVDTSAVDLGDYQVETACIGYSYTSVMETLSPEMGAAGGSAQMAYGTITEVFLRLNRSLGGRVGGSDATNMETILYRSSESAMDASPDLFTDDYRTPIEMKWERGKRLRVDHSDPAPFNLLGLFYDLRVHG